MASKKKAYGIFEMMRDQLTAGLVDKYANMAWNVFTWDGFPKAMPRKYPEAWLYRNGLCSVMYPKGSDEAVCLPVAVETIRNNFYGEPTEWRVMPVAGDMFESINYKLTPENAVLIRNCDNYTPTEPYVLTLIDQLVNVEMTMRMNLNALKMPYVFESPDGYSTLQNKNTFMQIMECDPAMFKTGNLGDGVQVHQTGAPVILGDLISTYTEYDARILEYIGVNNIPIEKKERLLVDEVTANEEELNLGIRSRMEQRQVACERMAEVLGLDVRCRFSAKGMEDRSLEGSEEDEDEYTEEESAES